MTQPNRHIGSTEGVPTDAFRAPRLERGWGDPPKHIHAVRYRVEVVNANAPIVAADVIEFGSLWQRRTKQYPDPYVCRASSAVQHGLRVTIAAREPASGDIARPSEVDLCQEAPRKPFVTRWRHRPKGTS